MHQGLTASILESRLQENCPQVLIEDARYTPPTQAEPLAKKTPGPRLSRTSYISSNRKPQHQASKRVNEAAFQQFSQRVDQAYTHNRSGHSTHSLWQKGDRVRCTQCGIQWHLDGEKPLSEFFKKKSEAGSTADEDHQPPTQDAASHKQANTKATALHHSAG